MVLSSGSGVSRFKVSDGNLGLLQEQLRRDPESYRDEFLEQFQHFQQFINILELEPKLHRSSVEQLLEVTNFLIAVAFCYPEEAKTLGQKLIELLLAKADELGHDLRLAFCRTLIALRNAQRISAMEILPILFHLFKCDDKQLRKFIKSALLSIIKHTKVSSKSQRRKRRQRNSRGGASLVVSLSAESSRIQAYIFAQLNDSSTTAAHVAQQVLILAYRKSFWRDAKTANVLAECVFHKVQRIQLSTMRFFLGSVEDEEGGQDDEDSDSDAENKKDNAGILRDATSSLLHAKKTRKRAKNLERAKSELIKSSRSKKESRGKFCNLEALNAIYDPQKYVDRLFGTLETKRNEKFVLRLMKIALCARLIGIHRLQTLGFYSYLHRYAQPKQRDVTRILLYAAQACHELVPPDLVEALVRRIAQNFITDQNTPEAITVGLNTIREIFATCPAAATEELLRDLTEYKSYKNKNVSMAARSLITLFRNVNPKLLHYKDRGRPSGDEGILTTSDGTSVAQYGALTAVDFVPGAEVLPEYAPAPETQRRKMKRNRRCGTASDEEDENEDEWMDVFSENDQEECNKDAEQADDNAGSIKELVNKDDMNSDNDDDADEWETASDEDDEDEESGWETCSSDEVHREELKQSDEAVSTTAEEKPKNVSFKLPTKVEKKATKALEKAEAQREALAKAKLVSESRILTDSDFRAIRVAQLRRKMAVDKHASAQKRLRTNDDMLIDEEIQEKIARREAGGDGLPRLNDIEHFHKKIYRQNKAERLAQANIDREAVLEARKPKKAGPHVGRTNRELAKHKNYQMVKPKLRGKNRQRSFRDRQISLRNYLQKQAGKKNF